MSEDLSKREWNTAGEIRLVDGKLVPPDLPDIPGVYRLIFNGGTMVYIGESGNLKRRIGDYLLYYQSVGIESEFRINKALFEAEGARIEILVGPDFSSRSQRCVRESFEIKEARSNNKIKVLNGGSLEDRIKFYKFEITRLEKLIDARKSEDGDQL